MLGWKSGGQLIRQGLALVLALQCGVQTGCAAKAAGPQLEGKFTGVQPGSFVLDFKVENVQGRVSTLRELHETSGNDHKVMLLVFFASWCTSCQHEMSRFDVLQKRFEPLKFQVIPISVMDDLQSLEAFGSAQHVSFPFYRDYSGELRKSFGIHGLPEAFVVDRSGNLSKMPSQELFGETVKISGPGQWTKPAVVADLVQILDQR